MRGRSSLRHSHQASGGSRIFWDALTYSFVIFLSKSTWKWNNLDREWEAHVPGAPSPSLDPPMRSSAVSLALMCKNGFQTHPKRQHWCWRWRWVWTGHKGVNPKKTFLSFFLAFSHGPFLDKQSCSSRYHNNGSSNCKDHTAHLAKGDRTCTV